MTEKLTGWIKEARKRGYGDLQIREALLKQGWSLSLVEKAFLKLTPKYKFKNQVCIFLDSELLKNLEKRAKKNIFTISEQIEDILRRSCLMSKNIKRISEKCDDKLVSIFSREKRGKK